ncbi:MAG: hypothetical protein H6581_25545 [Bacteroidia bacterium]|nr:hypothetical protein [Bacteroidia bacterium]
MSESQDDPSTLINVIAQIKLYKGPLKRSTSFADGYRPLFQFESGKKTSGQISLRGEKEIEPGQEAVVEIRFLKREFLGSDFGPGKLFEFFESREPLGKELFLKLLQMTTFK